MDNFGKILGTLSHYELKLNVASFLALGWTCSSLPRGRFLEVPEARESPSMTTPYLSLKSPSRMAYGETYERQFAVAVVGASFSGGVVVFDDHRKLAGISEALVGFPKHAGDAAAFDFGVLDRVHVHFSTDAGGHVSATVLLEKFEGPPTDGYPESLSVRFLCDPSNIDEFRCSIARFVTGEAGEAKLVGRAHGF